MFLFSNKLDETGRNCVKKIPHRGIWEQSLFLAFLFCFDTPPGFIHGECQVLLAAGLPVPQKHEIPALLVLGAVNTGLAYLLYFSGMQNIPAHSVALLSYVEPVSALLFAALFLKEAMSPIQLLGAVLILGGALLGEWKRPAASGT